MLAEYLRSLSSTWRMKLTLFICISLIANLLHAAVMPIDGSGKSMMDHELVESAEDSHVHHALMKPGADYDVYNCADYQSSCCLFMIPGPGRAMPLNVILRDEVFASRSLDQPIYRLESLYRPPKLYPASAG